MDIQSKIMQAHINATEGLALRDDAFIMGLRVVTVVLTGLFTKPRQSGNGETSLFYPGGYASNFAKKGVATSWPFLWYSGAMKVIKPTGVQRVETPAGEKIKVNGAKEMDFQYWDEQEMETIPFNINLQFGPCQLQDLLRGDKGELLKSPAGMAGAWYAMQAELLERGNTQLQFLLIPTPDSASAIQVAPFHKGSHKVATWELGSKDMGSVLWASKGDPTYQPGLGLADQIVDVSSWERDGAGGGSKPSVIKPSEVVPKHSKVKGVLNKQYANWLQEEATLEQSGNREIQEKYLASMCKPGTPFGAWIKVEGNLTIALGWLSSWKPKGSGTSRGMGMGNPQTQPEPEPEPKPEPKPESQPEPEPQPEIEAAKPRRMATGMGAVSSHLVGDTEGDFE